MKSFQKTWFDCGDYSAKKAFTHLHCVLHSRIQPGIFYRGRPLIAHMNAMLLKTLKALECSLHDARRHDREWLERLLHPDFREITRSGKRVDRAETIASLVCVKTPPPVLSRDFELTHLREGCVILHYRTFHVDGSRESLRTSCWLLSEEDRWTLVFHQGTPAAGAV